jgi:hypothetical protein
MSGGHSIIVAALLGLGMTILAAPIAQAQDATCAFHKVQTKDVNVGRDPRPDAILIDLIDRGDVVCVTRQVKVGAVDWAFVEHKLDNGQRRPVQGWTELRAMQRLSPAETAALQLAAPAAPAAAPPAPPPVAAPAAPPAAAAPPASASAEGALKFNEPVPFGAFPVNGRSIQELATMVPMFPPIEGLDEALWKKNCSACHRWDRAQLCEQGASYAKNPRSALRHPHPFGGAYKVALMNWAKSGCQ